MNGGHHCVDGARSDRFGSVEREFHFKKCGHLLCCWRSQCARAPVPIHVAVPEHRAPAIATALRYSTACDAPWIHSSNPFVDAPRSPPSIYMTHHIPHVDPFTHHPPFHHFALTEHPKCQAFLNPPPPNQPHCSPPPYHNLTAETILQFSLQLPHPQPHAHSHPSSCSPFS